MADVVKNWPAKIQSSKDVADVKGVGKSSKSLVGNSLCQTSWQLQLQLQLCLHACQGYRPLLCSEAVQLQLAVLNVAW